jgi:hypothetical protein
MKRIKILLIVGLTLNIISFSVFAQQGNVAAGGDATGQGGIMSYSVGQTDYLMFSSQQGSISLGLQQPYFYSIQPVYAIPETTVLSGQALCFNATETVIVAGDGKHFTVEPGGFAEIIAGQNILIKDGTTVEPGGMFHAYISNVWCSKQESLIASFVEPDPVKPIFKPDSDNYFFKVYPNPTKGIFTLELLEFEEFSNIQFEIYTMQGNMILSNQLPVQQFHTLSLENRQPGIYLIRVLKNNQSGTTRLIRY